MTEQPTGHDPDATTAEPPGARTPVTSDTAGNEVAGGPGAGPNYRLVGVSLLLGLGSMVVIWYSLDLPAVSLPALDPRVLVIGGLAFVLVGEMGLLRDRRRRRKGPPDPHRM
ncbi:MAG: hypothetical protein CSA84_06365 [Actinomycetales bacterium]|nr:MAG: hypothetical protein CSA84_06365 [Actinomycetales bacterium]